jgi:hypothetical protein
VKNVVASWTKISSLVLTFLFSIFSLSGCGGGGGSAGGSSTPPPFQATPIIDFTSAELYLGKFAGFLYNGTNDLTGQHDTDGRGAASAVVKLDSSGNPSATGSIGVVAIGMSNWNEEMCGMEDSTGCQPGTFFQQAESDQAADTVNPAIIFVNCAQPNMDAGRWTTITGSAWQNCLNIDLSNLNLNAAQVEVVLWMDATEDPTANGHATLASLPGSSCTAGSAIDACFYEANVGIVARLVKTAFPNARLMFVHSRTYAGFATTRENPEPFAYEYGFSTRWLVQAQINEIAGEGIDPIAGDLNYSIAPVILWGPYFWADACPNTRSDGLCWNATDFQSDGTHPAQSGWTKVGDMMMSFYMGSPYATPWFLP